MGVCRIGHEDHSADTEQSTCMAAEDCNCESFLDVFKMSAVSHFTSDQRDHLLCEMHRGWTTCELLMLRAGAAEEHTPFPIGPHSNSATRHPNFAARTSPSRFHRTTTPFPSLTTSTSQHRSYGSSSQQRKGNFILGHSILAHPTSMAQDHARAGR